LAPKRYHYAGKAKQTLKETGKLRPVLLQGLTEMQCRKAKIAASTQSQGAFDDFGKHLFTTCGHRRGVGGPHETSIAECFHESCCCRCRQ
jgi:hypothetical protein